MKTHEMRDLFYAVNVVYKNYAKQGKKVQGFWAERMHELFQKGEYDLAYEYVAMQELLLFKSISKTDPYRIKVWRMFVTDARRAFSDHEFANFQRLKKDNII